MSGGVAPRLGRPRARALSIPTDRPEADGTLAWTATTLVLAEIEAGGEAGLGYTYGPAAVAGVIEGLLGAVLEGRAAWDVGAAWDAMRGACRNAGQAGIAALAVSAVDIALWDLKAKLMGRPLAALLGRRRQAVPVYGSGGFTSYDEAVLTAQLAGWAAEGCRWVKMKIGSEPERDLARVDAALAAIGGARLFVDANGAYGARQAVGFGAAFAERGVAWFEEPVSADDLEGLRFVRGHLRAPVELAAGEYLFGPEAALRMLQSGAVDVLQADATRCGGVSGFLAIGAMCAACHVDLSGHCAPAAHLAVAGAVPRLRHLEWFHDHVRIERMLFDGAPEMADGAIAPDMTRPGHGLRLKAEEAAAYAIH